MKRRVLILCCALLAVLALASVAGATFWTKVYGPDGIGFPQGEFKKVQTMSDTSLILAGIKTDAIIDINFNLLWKSTDGGVTVNPVYEGGLVAPSFFCRELIQINDLRFMNENTGIVFGAWGNSNDSCTILTAASNYIANTLDGGGNWGDIALQPVMPETSLTATDFLDENHAIAAGAANNIWMTDNGGGSWNFAALDVPADAPGTASSIAYVDEYDAYITIDNNYYYEGDRARAEKGAKAATNAGALIATNNGGLSWNTLQGDAQMGFMKVQFMERKGWLIASNFTTKKTEIRWTDDGGDTWQTALLPFVAGVGDPGAGYALRDLRMLDANVGWAVGGDYGDISGYVYHSVILRTDDGGRTWDADDYRGVGLLQSISMLNGRRGYAVGTLAILSFYNANNSPPTADAGPNQNVFLNQTATLDGSGSRDADGDALTYQWEMTTGPETILLNDATLESPTFTPTVAGAYTFSLTVSDGSATSEPESVDINVQDPNQGDDTGDDTAGDDATSSGDDDNGNGGCCG